MSVAETIKAELLVLCPDFAMAWNDECDLFTSDDGSFTAHGVLIVFSHYVADRLSRGSAPSLSKVFDFVESKLTEDDSEMDNAATTCFLENLMNRVSEKIAPRHLVLLLGPKSRRFCRAWDEWCRVRTEGL
jgi:hypothetical protein